MDRLLINITQHHKTRAPVKTLDIKHHWHQAPLSPAPSLSLIVIIIGPVTNVSAKTKTHNKDLSIITAAHQLSRGEVHSDLLMSFISFFVFFSAPNLWSCSVDVTKFWHMSDAVKLTPHSTDLSRCTQGRLSPNNHGAIPHSRVPPFSATPLSYPQTILDIDALYKILYNLCVFSANFGSCQSRDNDPKKLNHGVGKTHYMLSFLSGGITKSSERSENH